MDRDEFMELVYETFADEPDNVLANGIIEAADAYAENEKAQLSKEGTTSDLISRQAALDAVEKNACNTQRIMDAVNNLPPAQPEPTDINAKEAVYNLAEKIGIHQLFALTVELRGEPIQPEPQWIPVSERLPEKGGEYLVSVHHTIGAISVFHPEKDTYVDDVAIMKYYGKFPSTVRAWMPLPEAYKPNK